LYILDTGAPHLTINQEVDDAEFELATLGRSHNGKTVTIDHFQCGNISMKHLSAWAMDLTFAEQMLDRPIAGIVGSDLLSEHNVLIDFEAMEIRLMPLNERQVPVDPSSYSISSLRFNGYFNQMPIVDIQVNGVNRKMAFDTGAAISVLENSNRVLEETKEHHQELEVKINHIRIDSAPFVAATIEDITTGCDACIDGILSVSSLNPSKVLISYAASRIHMFWFTIQAIKVTELSLPDGSI